ncbi:SART-1 protein [Aspergillus egyptiacus]|nr:SART-1 protein [Aspergillus egyptiacus]
MADAISIEQNNKIRAALGLKPLPVPGADATEPSFKESNDNSSDEEPASTLETREAAASDNWKKLQDEAEAKKRRDERNAAIKRAREIAQRNAKLEGPTLGESGDVDMDTKAWLLQAKKRQKKIERERARKLAEELEERQRVAEYTASDLAGIKVGHEVGEFGGGEEHILTLKDTTIDENEEEGDELENTELREKEKVAEKLELKKRKPAYDPTEENTSILAQYDEEIDGKKRKRFTLDAQGSTAEEQEARRQEVSEKLKRNVVSLDFEADTPISDYMDVSEIKIKKPKKKKTKTTKKRSALDEDDIFPTESTDTPNGASSMEVDTANGTSAPEAAPRKRVDEDISFVDDDDLQASLTRQRRAALKKRQRARPEDIARQLREESSQTPMDVEGQDEEEPGLIIDETSEFVSNLQKPVLPEHRERHERRSTTPVDGLRAKTDEPDEERPEQDGDVDMERSYNDIEDEEDLKERIKREEEEANAPLSGTGLEEETTLNKGLGATLGMLKKRGLVKSTDAAEHNALLRDRQKFIAEKQRLETDAERRARQQREMARASGKLDRMSAREREEYARWENKQRDQQEARHMAEVFNKEYKPDVQLKYIDEFGRSMNQKEAFKHLSHQFHGKGSGKMKTEKRLKKIEEEKKREAMSALDSSQHTGMNNAMGATARKNRQAGVRLG